MGALLDEDPLKAPPYVLRAEMNVILRALYATLDPRFLYDDIHLRGMIEFPRSQADGDAQHVFMRVLPDPDPGPSQDPAFTWLHERVLFGAVYDHVVKGGWNLPAQPDHDPLRGSSWISQEFDTRGAGGNFDGEVHLSLAGPVGVHGDEMRVFSAGILWSSGAIQAASRADSFALVGRASAVEYVHFSESGPAQLTYGLQFETNGVAVVSQRNASDMIALLTLTGTQIDIGDGLVGIVNVPSQTHLQQRLTHFGDVILNFGGAYTRGLSHFGSADQTTIDVDGNIDVGVAGPGATLSVRPGSILHAYDVSFFDKIVTLQTVAGNASLKAVATSDAVTGVVPVGYVKIDVGGTPRYIPFVAA